MARVLTLDTSFLIDLERERRRREEGRAHQFLQAEAASEVCIASTVLGELAEGYGDPDHPVLQTLRRTHRVLAVDDEVALHYGRIARALRAEGSMIGANDLWIASTSVRHGLPLVTRDQAHFRRVPGLELIRYT